MTEADARTLLRDCGGFGGLEAWIAERRWRAAHCCQCTRWSAGGVGRDPVNRQCGG
jgi:hypothetical protein